MPDIVHSGVLRAITIVGSTSYFVHRGRAMGFEYELLQRLAEHLGVRLQMVVADDIDLQLGMLRNGEGDLVGCSPALCGPRLEQVAFTAPHMTTRQVLVQRKPETWRQMRPDEIDRLLVRSIAELAGKTVHVQRGSSSYERLKQVAEELGDEIMMETVEGTVSTETLIGMVAGEVIDYTVADENLARLCTMNYPILDVGTMIDPSRRIAWAVRRSSPRLRAAVSKWVAEMRNSAEYYVIYNRYFRNRPVCLTGVRAEALSLSGAVLSPYDSLIQVQAGHIGWDWRLMAALVYQESQFDPEAQSWAGACGLMQLLPATAEKFGIAAADVFDAAKNIQAGAKYLSYLERLFADVPDTAERIKFVLAAYNVGEAPIMEAQHRAGKYGEDPSVWTDTVEEYVRMTADQRDSPDNPVESGSSPGCDPAQFVREILARYEHYRRVVGDDSTATQMAQGLP